MEIAVWLIAAVVACGWQGANLWVNRLIGDQHLPEDSERYGGQSWAAPALKKWPQWLLEDKPSPTARLAFTTWNYWTKDDTLLESGLLGPVRIIPTSVGEIKVH